MQSSWSRQLQICKLAFISIHFRTHWYSYTVLLQGEDSKVIKDCTEAITIHPHYPKPLLRRAQTYEKTEKLDEALEDYKKLLELDNKNTVAAAACQVTQRCFSILIY